MWLLAHVCSYALDHAEPEMEIQAEQVHKVFGGQQASNGVDTNLDLTKASPSTFNQYPCLLF
jgi:hypothetical protein